MPSGNRRYEALTLFVPVVLAQSAPLAFEVASIKPSAPGGSHGVWTDGSPIRICTLGMSVKQLIGFAYYVEGYRVTAKGPVFSEPYDVVAKLPDDAAALPDAERGQRIHTMTQTLLADRFRLTLHRATAEMSVYALVAAKTGAKIKELGPNPGDNVLIDRCPGHLAAKQMPMSQLVGIRRSELKQPVLDETGIKGVFDIALDWAAVTVRSAPGAVGAQARSAEKDARDSRGRLRRESFRELTARYSDRSAVIGSTRVARRAGSQAANSVSASTATALIT